MGKKKKDGFIKKAVKETVSSAIPVPYLNDKIADIAVDKGEDIAKGIIKKKLFKRNKK